MASVLLHVMLTAQIVQAGATGDTIPAPPEPGSSAMQAADQTQEKLEVWIDLSVPALSTLTGENAEARAALRARIKEQQDEVMTQLASLGAVEDARVEQVRNAIAVRIPESALAQVRSIPGVVKVRVVKHRKTSYSKT